MQPITLSFHGKSVKLVTLLDQLKTLPLIDVRFDELAKENRYANRGRPIEDNEEEISVFRIDGYYIVLTGKSALEKVKTFQSFKARLVSKQALKHLQFMGDDTQVRGGKSQFMRPISPAALRGETSDQR